MFFFVAFLGGLARAHPMGSDMNGHRLELILRPDRLEADLVLEMPTQRMLKDLRAFLADRPPGTSTEAFTEALAGELVSGLRLRVDDVPTPWTRLDEGAPSGEADARFVSARVRLSAVLPEGARTLAVVNGNLPDEASLYLVSLRVADALILDDSSLWERDAEGRIVRDREGQWRLEEDSRDLRLSFQRRPLAWAALLRGARALGGGGREALGAAVDHAAGAPWAGLDEAGRRALRAVGLTLALFLGLGAVDRALGRSATGLVAGVGAAAVGVGAALAGAGALPFDLLVGVAAALTGASRALGALRGAGWGDPAVAAGRRWVARVLQAALALALLPLGLAFIWRGVQALRGP